MAILTAKDIAERIQRPGEPLSAAVNRLRNWTATGIIKAASQKHPGTGHKRRYSAIALLQAMLLQTLTDTLGTPAADLVDSLEDLAGMVATAARRPGRTPEPAALVISGPTTAPMTSVSKVFIGGLAQHIRESPHEVHTVINLRRFVDRLPPDAIDDFKAATLGARKPT